MIIKMKRDKEETCHTARGNNFREIARVLEDRIIEYSMRREAISRRSEEKPILQDANAIFEKLT